MAADTPANCIKSRAGARPQKRLIFDVCVGSAAHSEEVPLSVRNGRPPDNPVRDRESGFASNLFGLRGSFGSRRPVPERCGCAICKRLWRFPVPAVRATNDATRCGSPFAGVSSRRSPLPDPPTSSAVSYAPSGIYPGGIRSNFCNEESIVSHAWPRMLYVTTCGLNWLGSSRLAAWTAIRSGIATNVR